MTQTAAAKMITHARLLELTTYDPASGLFRWRVSVSRKSRAGKVIGTRSQATSGGIYIRGKIDHQLYSLHRLAWFYVHGTWPEYEIDHINGDSTDNRIGNLRDVASRVNRENIRSAKQNSKTGLLGVMPTRGKKFRSAIRVKGEVYHLGHFDTAEAAYEAYISAKRLRHEGCTL
jgi:hypothetical protein